MNDIKTNVDGLVAMIKEGKILEAFEKYYDENVVMQENEEVPRVGKEANRKFEEAFVHGITEVHDSKILGVAYGENYSTIESFMDITHKEWGRMAATQIAVEQWKDGKVVHEKFYYTPKK